MSIWSLMKNFNLTNCQNKKIIFTSPKMACILPHNLKNKKLKVQLKIQIKFGKIYINLPL